MRNASLAVTAITALCLTGGALAQQQGQQQGMGGMPGMNMGMGGMDMSMGAGGMQMQMPGMPPMRMGPGGCMMMGQGGMSGMGGMGMGGMGMGGMGGGMMMPPIEQRLAMAKTQLGITDAQGSAWEAYAKAATAHSGIHKTNHEAMMKGMQSGSVVDRMDIHIKNMEAMVAALKDLKPAMAGLFAVLSDQQKQLANTLLEPHCMM